jgi:hypothetical protein
LTSVSQLLVNPTIFPTFAPMERNVSIECILLHISQIP